MNVLRRSWVVIGLWMASLVLALLFPAQTTDGRDIFLNLSYLFGGLLIISYLWARFGLLGVRITRHLRTNRSQVGKYAEEILLVENTGPLPKLWLEVRDHSDLPFHRVSRVVSWLPAHQQRSWVTKTPCYRRGRFELGPITLYSGDPFGLFLLRREIELTGSLVVYPLTAGLPAFSPPQGEMSGGSLLRRRTHYVTTNVSGVRDYAPGDSFNRIHWPSTARTGHLIVKEFELDPLADVWLFLDMEMRVHVGRPGSLAPDVTLPSVLHVLLESPGQLTLDPTTEEYAVAAAASLARHFLDRGWSLGMVTYPRDQRRTIVQADRGPRQLDRLLSMLAVVRPLGSVPLAQVLEAETIFLTRNSVVIVITPCATAADWVPALRRLTLRGVRASAVVIDPASFVPGSSGAEDADALAAGLAASRVRCYLVRDGDRIQDVLQA
jgi:uncharacterized protein (DUF58 family)